MSKPQGRFVWYDVMTTDVKAAEAFYRKVVGWEIADSGMPDRSYMILSMGSTMIGGMMPIPDSARAMGMKPAWMGYIGVDDVDAYAKRVTEAGGTIHRPPEDIPGVGRFAVAADPDGAGFLLFTPKGGAEPAAPQMTPGHVGWHELNAGNGERAFAFYSGLFGWTKAETMDMGPLGTYQLFATGGNPVGGMMTKTADTPAPYWLYYFVVDDIDAAMKRVADAGGRVIFGPQEVPGGAWIVQCTDPQGAMFALVGGRKQQA